MPGSIIISWRVTQRLSKLNIVFSLVVVITWFMMKNTNILFQFEESQWLLTSLFYPFY